MESNLKAIPESVVKAMEEDANVKYQFPFEDMDIMQNQKIIDLRKSYLSGRQDEYRKQVGEIERLKWLIRDIWESKDNGDATGDNEYWNMFKTKHSI